MDEARDNDPFVHGRAADSWVHLVEGVVLRMPERFQLHDLDMHFETFRRAYPRNRNVDAKVRQTLQILRDRNVLEFIGKGRYLRLVPRPNPSVYIDFGCAAHLTSRAQRARIALETWANFNLWCYRCGNPTLIALPPSAPVSDLRCTACEREYQVKSKDGRFGNALTGAAFAPLAQRILSNTLPDYLLIEYETPRSQVTHLNAIHGADITLERVVARKPLNGTARRAGWIGCNIRIAGLPQWPIVAPGFLAHVKR